MAILIYFLGVRAVFSCEMRALSGEIYVPKAQGCS